MARFGAGRKSKSGKKKALQLKGRQMSKKRPLLPKKGVTQTSYETGFFDFFKVFWKNNQRMELCNLTKQVVNAWEALLPKPKLSKRKVLKDYSKEYKALQEETRRQLLAKQELQRNKRENMERKRMKKTNEDDSGTETEANSRSNFDDTDESIRSDKRGGTDNESQSSMDEKQTHTDDESMSEKNSASYGESGSEYESDKETLVENRREKRKRKGRKYKSYDEYVKIRNKKFKLDSDDADGNSKGRAGHETNQEANNRQDQQEDCDKVPKDNIFFPMREEQSFDRIVRNNYDDQNEMLRKLKEYGSNIDSDNPENDNKRTDSVDSLSSGLAGPKFPSQGRHSSGKLCTPTDTLHVKNLVVGIRQPELQDIFRVFLNDIVLIRVLDNKFNGEAVVAFKNVEAAQKAWSQMNGVEYKRLPLVLEFSNKEDLL
ncbi:NF-kappa-B-activating protein-like [Coccinella septempunctata]|uniref:NF-kappa-B-activating protein-like n=1 Tax=Coccinella septempunctata TaxID=41139 RepID=UPI001D086E1D|nr:NF-kappa-B-activating protein-like [Coccinella septempunctata]